MEGKTLGKDRDGKWVRTGDRVKYDTDRIGTAVDRYASIDWLVMESADGERIHRAFALVVTLGQTGE